MRRLLRIAEAPRELYCSAEWLRDAEKKGKIPPAKRDLNGWRVYTEEDIAQIKSLMIPGEATRQGK